MIGFSLLSLGGGIAVGFISYEAIDWDADDFGDGDGKVCMYHEHLDRTLRANIIRRIYQCTVSRTSIFVNFLNQLCEITDVVSLFFFQRIARLACEAVRAFCALWVILMSFAAIIIGLKSMCSSDEEVIYVSMKSPFNLNIASLRRLLNYFPS